MSKGKKVLANQKERHIGINISLPLKDLLLVDKVAKNARLTRNAWIRYAIEKTNASIT
jgi:hypothetical protein